MPRTTVCASGNTLPTACQFTPPSLLTCSRFAAATQTRPATVGSAITVSIGSAVSPTGRCCQRFPPFVLANRRPCAMANRVSDGWRIRASVSKPARIVCIRYRREARATVIAAEQPIPAKQIDPPRDPQNTMLRAWGRLGWSVGSAPASVEIPIDTARCHAQHRGSIRRKSNGKHRATDQGRSLLRPATAAIDRGPQSGIGAHQQVVRIARVDSNGERRIEVQSDIRIKPGAAHAARAKEAAVSTRVMC